MGWAFGFGLFFIDYQLFGWIGMGLALLGKIELKMKEEPEGGSIDIRIAVPADVKYVYPVLEEMERSARARGTGIARRTPQSICKKIYEGKAVIAVTASGDWAGFSYVEVWGDGAFVSNSGLIVNPVYRGAGVAHAIKERVFALSREKYPAAAVFSITTGAAVMKMNHRLGFEPVTYDQITRDERFWDQCKQCVNYGILEGTGKTKCLCTAMLYRPAAIGHAGIGG
jgi:N-acetylglutamate synthase-like GNAT family acetyltransferase